MSFYDEMQAVASELMAEFAQGTVTLTRPGAQTPAGNEWEAPTIGDPTTWTLDATAKGVSQEFVDGQIVKSTDIEVTFGVFADEPQMADIITIDGKPHTILLIRRVPEAGTVVVWRVVVKG